MRSTHSSIQRAAPSRTPDGTANRPDDLRALLKSVVVGIGTSGIAFLEVGGNPSERLHRVVWVLLLLVVMCTIAAANASESSAGDAPG
jgi:hypothetical protein